MTRSKLLAFLMRCPAGTYGITLDRELGNAWQTTMIDLIELGLVRESTRRMPANRNKFTFSYHIVNVNTRLCVHKRRGYLEAA